jgi:DNA mismatch repair protein MutL
MGADDLLLCVEKHTTSKIALEVDLDTIATLGFRGEALASIAAVARVRITSRLQKQEEAYRVQVEASMIDGPTPAARAPGTTIEVRDLFFNLPARARFLGSARTEFFHSNRVIHRLALSSPKVGWSLKHGERLVFSAPHAKELLDRIAQVYGAQVAQQLIPIEIEHNGIRITGYISPPDIKRGNRRDQLFCINGRPVSDRALSYVLASSYQGILRHGSYPLAVLRIDLPLEGVDVNVHPRKEEIRFAEPRRVQEALTRVLQGALSSRYVVSPFLSQGSQERTQPHSSQGSSALPLDLQGAVSVRKAERAAEKVRVRSDRRVIGQLQGTYLLIETPTGLEIVDQHIAHERILYEKLRADLARGEIPRQSFLLPVRLELPFESAELLTAGREELAKVGIVLDEFGGGTFILREYPSLLAEGQSRYGFQGTIEQIVEQLARGEKVRDTLFDHLLSELACGAAIKAGDRIPLQEQQDLVDRLMTLENPYTCPHGRPIIFTISRKELDRRFKRD